MQMTADAMRRQWEKRKAALRSRTVLVQACGAAACMLAACARMPWSAMPLALCMLCGAQEVGVRVYVGVLGAAAGRMLSALPLGWTGLAADMLCLLLFGGALMLAKRLRVQEKDAPWVQMGAMALSLLLASVLTRRMLAYDWVMLLVQGAVAALLHRVFLQAARLVGTQRARRVFSSEETLALCVVAAVLLAGLAPLRIGGVSPASIATFLLVMLCGYIGGASIGAACGAACGLALAAGMGGPWFLIGNLAVCGLACGMFRPIGRWASATAFVLLNTLLTLMINQSTQVIIPLGESLPALAVFLLLPKKQVLALMGMVNASQSRQLQYQAYVGRIQSAASLRLKELGEVFGEMSRSFKSVVPVDAPPAAQQVVSMMRKVAGEVCGDCALKNCCWQREFDQTFAWLRQVMEDARDAGGFARKMIPQSFARRCMKLDALCEAVDGAVYMYLLKRTWEKRIDESRMLVAEQLQGVSEVVQALAKEMKLDMRYDDEMEKNIRVALDKRGIAVGREVSANSGAEGWEVRVQNKPCGGRMRCARQGAQAVSEAVGRPMQLCMHTCAPNDSVPCQCVYRERALYALRTGAAQAAGHAGEVSGDNYAMTKVRGQRYLMAISDGMGSGARAASESDAAVSLLTHFYKAGFERDVILRSINRLLILRSGEEMFATVDMCLFDLSNGACEMTKIGAAPGFLLRGGRAQKAPSATLPIGIVEEVRPDASRWQLEEGDGVVLMSDGVSDAIGEETLLSVVEALAKDARGDAQLLCDLLLETARALRGENAPCDDMTVLAAYLTRAEGAFEAQQADAM
nr:stage II sporulation protein E [Maliibacterium massiliense]